MPFQISMNQSEHPSEAHECRVRDKGAGNLACF